MKLIENWKAGFDFFLATKWSDWTKLSNMDSKYIFSHKTVWFIRYFVSVPLFFGPLFYVASNAHKVADSIGINSYIIVWFFINLALYPLIAFWVCRATGVIKDKHSR